MRRYTGAGGDLGERERCLGDRGEMPVLRRDDHCGDVGERQSHKSDVHCLQTSVLTAFSQKLESEFFHPLAERHMSYADAIVFQARLYRRLIEGEVTGYSPLMLR